jgi:deazaflavin-dependent oxidoreductase (nitroreductase family)
VKATPFNQKTIAEFHTKKGRGVGAWGDHVLLMTAKGAKSGEAITTPLVYGREGNDYIIVASKGGAPQHPTWFGNIVKNPEVEIEVANEQGPRSSRPAPARLRKETSAIAFTKKCPRSGRHLPTTRRAPTA